MSGVKHWLRMFAVAFITIVVTIIVLAAVVCLYVINEVFAPRITHRREEKVVNAYAANVEDVDDSTPPGIDINRDCMWPDCFCSRYEACMETRKIQEYF